MLEQEISRLKKELDYYKRMYEMNRLYDSMRAINIVRLKDENENLRLENEKLRQQLYGNKSVNISDDNIDTGTEMYKKQIENLKKKIEEDRQTIFYLKNVLHNELNDSDCDEELAYKAYVNNSTIKKLHNNETKERIIKLRKEGASIREIASIESVSVGYVHKVIHTEDSTFDT